VIILPYNLNEEQIMAVEYYTPGVYVEEIPSGSKPMTAAPTNIVGFIGETRQGAINKPVMITSWEQYFNTFIGYNIVDKITPRGTVEKDIDGNIVKEEVPFSKVTDLDWGVYTFFANGGCKCHVVSVKNIENNDDKIAKLNDDLSKAQEQLEKAKDKNVVNKQIADIQTQIKGLSSSSDISKEIIGNDGGPNKRSGLSCFKDVSEVAILVAPGVVKGAVQQELLSYAEAANIFLILDAPETLDGLSEYGLSTDLNGLAGLSAKCASKQSAVYFPWINVYDPDSDSDRAVAPSGAVAGVYARVDNSRGVHKAPANEPIRLATSLAYSLSDTEQESLNMNGVNVIRDFSDSGITLWGARTTVSMIDAEWRYINVRRLFNMIEKTLELNTKWAVFEPNDSKLWGSLTRNTKAFLTRLFNAGAFAGNSTEQGFYVKCNDETNPQENVDAGIVTIEIGIAPVKPAEFIVFKVSQKAPTE
jgi:phage tail sheath protein FI